MSAKKEYIIYSLILFGFIFFCYVILDIPAIDPIWNFFADPQDYLRQSNYPLFSKEFYIPEPAMWFTPRPFTVPLFYKLAGSEPERMLYFQKAFYCFSVGVFVVSVLRFLAHHVLKLVMVLVLFFFFTWWNIVGWSNNILSESISFSFFLLWLSALFGFIVKRNWVWTILLMSITLFFSFTRDTWPYLILMSFVGIALFDAYNKHLSRKMIVLVMFSLVLFVFQGHTVSVGKRSALPVFNTLAGRIVQNEEHLNWFVKEGMPQADQLRSDFKGIAIDTQDGKQVLYKRYTDSTYTVLFDWVKENGKSKYQKFLITHFQYFILNDQTLQQLDRIFAYNHYGYYQVPQKFFHNADNVFPLFNSYVALVLVLVCVIMWYKFREIHLLFPAFICMLLIANVYLSYNADTMEVERHLYITRIGIEMMSLLSLGFLTHIFLKHRKSLFSKEKRV